MASTTTNLELTKPAYTEAADVSVINENSDKIDTEAGKVRNNFSAEYSATQAYSVGDYCIRGGVLYRCTTAITGGGETWNSGHWTDVAIATEMVNKNTAETIGGQKTFTSTPIIKPQSRYKNIRFLQSGSDAPTGAIEYDAGNATNVTGGRMWFYEYSPKLTPDTGTTGYYEAYLLPAVTSGLQANKEYSILTSKNFSIGPENITGNSSKTYDIGTGTRAILITMTASGDANMTMGFLTSSSTGQANYYPIKSGSNVTITTGTGSFTIANGGSNSMLIRVFLFQGSFAEST